MKYKKPEFCKGIIERYRSYLPVDAGTPLVSLQEGNTPLIYSEKLSKQVGLEVHLKYEGSNPTGSFKDRGMTVAVSKAKQNNAKAVLCASTGNTSASAAAYAAKANMACFVLLPEGAVAMGKLSQAMMCQAKVIPVKGNFDDALTLAREITSTQQIVLVNSLNPDRIEGQKTGALEVCDQLGGRSPDFHLMPVGNAGNISAYWRGYQDYLRTRMIHRLPRMLGFQAKGAAPIVLGRVIPSPKTFATAIRIGNPASWFLAECARYESGGSIDSVTDAEILKAYRWLAREEGLYVEPASAASVAGLFKIAKARYFKKMKAKKSSILVCVLTGHGLKDPSSALRILKMPRAVRADVKSVLKAIRS